MRELDYVILAIMVFILVISIMAYMKARKSSKDLDELFYNSSYEPLDDIVLGVIDNNYEDKQIFNETDCKLKIVEGTDELKGTRIS